MDTDYDILIIGGGLVGASLASALGRQALRVGVVEAVPLVAQRQPSYDDRAIALAQGTQRIFSSIGVWGRLSAQATPIHRIHVSDRGRFGFTQLDREQEGVAALGYVVAARAIGTALHGFLDELPAVEILCPAQLERLHMTKDCAVAALSLEGVSREVTARLVVAADGARSAVRDQLGFDVEEWDYGQTAIVANVTTQLPHRNVAYERFTDSGPMAVLPMGERHCTVVWTVKNDAAESVLAWDGNTFAERLQDRFGYRLGRLENPGARRAYPLRLIRAKESTQKRVALIGNAAHTLHPIAGQGFNLGVRDAAALAEVVVDALRAGEDPGQLNVLSRYAEWRQRDHARVTVFTDGLTRLFANPLASVSAVRDLGMLALELIPPARGLFTRLTMGQAGKLPRLSRGLPL